MDGLVALTDPDARDPAQTCEAPKTCLQLLSSNINLHCEPVLLECWKSGNIHATLDASGESRLKRVAIHRQLMPKD
jgi:hypothetical protein